MEKKMMCVHYLQIDVTVREIKNNIKSTNTAIDNSNVKWTSTYTFTTKV